MFYTAMDDSTLSEQNIVKIDENVHISSSQIVVKRNYTGGNSETI